MKKYKEGDIITLRKKLPYPEGSDEYGLSFSLLQLEGKKVEVSRKEYTPVGVDKENILWVKALLKSTISPFIEREYSIYIPKKWINEVDEMSEEFL